MKGKADVKWTENHGKTTVTYHNKEKYFSIKQFLIQEGQGNDTLNQGSHVLPFSFQIPQQKLPPSFRGSYGKILYTLEANLSRSLRVDSKAKAEFTVIDKLNLNSDSMLMSPQHETLDKKMKFFNSGAIGMDVNLERTGFYRGEGINIVASIHNKSSRDVKLKYSLYTKHSFFAQSRRKLHTKEILKEVGDPIPPSAGQTITKTITIPPDIGVSVLNCNILKVEYRLKVYLDVKYSSDPEIKFPIIILPALAETCAEPSAPPPAYGFETAPNFTQFGGANFFQEPPAYTPFAYASHPPPLNPEFYGMYPTLDSWDKKS